MASLILKVGNYLTVMAEACVSGVGLGGGSITIQNYFNMSLVRGPLFLIFSVDVYVLICFISSLHVVSSEAGLLLKFNWERLLQIRFIRFFFFLFLIATHWVVWKQPIISIYSYCI